MSKITKQRIALVMDVQTNEKSQMKTKCESRRQTGKRLIGTLVYAGLALLITTGAKAQNIFTTSSGNSILEIMPNGTVFNIRNRPF